MPRWLDEIAQDIRAGFRAMRQSPGVTLTAVATLAVGIGANVTVFTVTNAVLFKGFRSIDGNSRILYVGTQKDGRGCCVSYPDFADWRASATSFDGLGAVADEQVVVGDTAGAPERDDATRISANGFALLGRTPALGRDFTPADEAPGAPPVAILRDGFWKRRFAGDPGVVGRTIRVNGTLTTVVGVMPPGFSFPQNQDFWMPLVKAPNLQERQDRRLWFAFGRLRDGATFDGARAELATIGRRLAAEYPRTNEGWVPQPRTFAEFFVGRNAAAIYGAMWGAVACVLLIACANLAHLLLARAIGRSREMSVRIALGAGRWRIGRQLLVESLMLSAAGGIVGGLMAVWGVRAYELTANPPTLSWSEHLLDYTMDGRVLAYLVAISIGTGVLFGLAPMVRLSRLDVHTALKDGGHGAVGARGTRLSALLVIGEMALAVMLLAGAGLMIRSFLNLYTADLGVETADVSTMLLSLPAAAYPAAEARTTFFDRLDARLAAIPGVESTALASTLPTGGSLKIPYELADRPPVDVKRRPTLSALVVGPAYFHTLGATLLSGREFNDFDIASAPPIAIVNQRFAGAHWPGEDPLGRRLRLFDGRTPDAWRTVVGVVSDIVQDDATRQGFEPLVYLPYRQRPASSMWVLVRSRVAPGSLAASLRREVQTVDPELPVWLGPFALSERLAGSGSYWQAGDQAALFVIFAAIALLLASVGLYAVVAHAVGERTREIGIRMAIGATARDIRALVLAQGLLPLGLGLAIGLAGSLAVTRVLTAALVRVSPADPLVLVVASATLTASATLGCLVPARRATRVDPVVALRHE